MEAEVAVQVASATNVRVICFKTIRFSPVLFIRTIPEPYGAVAPQTRRICSYMIPLEVSTIADLLAGGCFLSRYLGWRIDPRERSYNGVMCQTAAVRHSALS